jgi:hypothetical protein
MGLMTLQQYSCCSLATTVSTNLWQTISSPSSATPAYEYQLSMVAPHFVKRVDFWHVLVKFERSSEISKTIFVLN